MDDRWRIAATGVAVLAMATFTYFNVQLRDWWMVAGGVLFEVGLLIQLRHMLTEGGKLAGRAALVTNGFYLAAAVCFGLSIVAG